MTELVVFSRKRSCGRDCAEGDFSCFPQFDSFVVSENMERDTVKTFLDGHLANMISSLSCLVAL